MSSIAAIELRSRFSGAMVGEVGAASPVQARDALDTGAAYVHDLTFNHPLNQVAHKLAPFSGIGDGGLGVKEGVCEAIRAMWSTISTRRGGERLRHRG